MIVVSCFLSFLSSFSSSPFSSRQIDYFPVYSQIPSPDSNGCGFTAFSMMRWVSFKCTTENRCSPFTISTWFTITLSALACSPTSNSGALSSFSPPSFCRLNHSFMPEDAASDPSKTVFHYKGITSPPKMEKTWELIITTFISHIIERYGEEEVSKWFFEVLPFSFSWLLLLLPVSPSPSLIEKKFFPFLTHEVWNEPNCSFWSGSPLQSTYYRLYQITYEAIKKVNSKLRGTPLSIFFEDNFSSSRPLPLLLSLLYPLFIEFIAMMYPHIQWEDLPHATVDGLIPPWTSSTTKRSLLISYRLTCIPPTVVYLLSAELWRRWLVRYFPSFLATCLPYFHPPSSSLLSLLSDLIWSSGSETSRIHPSLLFWV